MHHATLGAYSLFAPIIIWMIFRTSMKPGPYEMDPGSGLGGFALILQIYSRFFYVIAAASALGAIVAHGYSDFGLTLTFTVAGIEALLFNIVLAFFYEGYLAARYPRNGSAGISNYTVSRYSVVMALAVSAVATFVMAVLVLVLEK